MESNEKPNQILSITSQFFDKQYASYRSDPSNTGRPYFLGVSGVQGCGKTTFASRISSHIEKVHNARVVVLSIDDFYLPHNERAALAEAHPKNALLRTRGVPGTHDIKLALQTFSALSEGQEVKLPRYDKSAHNGAGDRVSESFWVTVTPSKDPVDVVLFEGWCVGFSSIGKDRVREAHASSQKARKSGEQLWRHDIESALFIERQLTLYQKLFDRLDAMIHIDTSPLSNVYSWRLEQEHALHRSHGTGMTDEAVEAFINNYMPVYEVYLPYFQRITSGLRDEGELAPWTEHILHLTLGKDREVVEVANFGGLY